MASAPVRWASFTSPVARWSAAPIMRMNFIFQLSPDRSGDNWKMKFIRMIGAADHRATGDVNEAHRTGALAIVVEFLWCHELDDRQMLQCRLEILAEG